MSAGDRPRLLDLFCGAGGAAMGYHRAGFDVTGVDVNPQPRYPFRFWQLDVMELEPWVLGAFDAIHASPPCQAYSHGTSGLRNGGKEYPDLLAQTRELLDQAGRPWVIENVPGAPMRVDYQVCGCQVGLRDLRRKRWFETSWHGFALAHPCNHDPEVPVLCVTGHGNTSWAQARFSQVYGRTPRIHDYRRAMGIQWMNRGELSQAIPPAYTEQIGRHLMAELGHTPCEAL